MKTSTPIDQLAGRHARLRLELGQAFLAPSRRSDEVDRIAGDLADTERQLAAVRPVDEQTDDPMLGFAW